MAKWIIEPGKVHHHEYPKTTEFKMEEVVGSVWECDCGARFKFVATFENGLGEPIAGEWEADYSTFSTDDLIKGFTP